MALSGNASYWGVQLGVFGLGGIPSEKDGPFKVQALELPRTFILGLAPFGKGTDGKRKIGKKPGFFPPASNDPQKIKNGQSTRDFFPYPPVALAPMSHW